VVLTKLFTVEGCIVFIKEPLIADLERFVVVAESRV
jgi:hypothetical protein